MTEQQRARILPMVTEFLTRTDTGTSWKEGAEALLDGITVVFPWKVAKYHEYSAIERDGCFIIYGHHSEDMRITTAVFRIEL